MKLIKLQGGDGHDLWINPEQVVAVTDAQDRSLVAVYMTDSGEYFNVKSDVQTVVKALTKS